MDLYKIRRFFTLFLTALGLFVLIFLTYSIFVISKVAQKKEKHEIKTGYAEEKISPSPTISPFRGE